MKLIFTTTSTCLFYLGGLNTLLARFAGTCTQGEAGRLWGIVLTAIIMAGALGALAASPRRRLILIISAPLALLLAWQTVFSMRLARDLLWRGISACESMEGIPYPMDGNEVFYGVAWPLVSAAIWVGLLVLWPRRGTEPRSRP